jgi:DNA-binding response OmpR family regulator
MIALVVDDSGPVRARITAMVAEAPGVHVMQARDGREAAAALAANPVDIVILDLHLPDCSGLQVLDRVKASDRAPLVVVLTNDASAQHRRECLLRGADHFFDKSLEFARAVEVVLALAARLAAAAGTTRLS